MLGSLLLIPFSPYLSNVISNICLAFKNNTKIKIVENSDFEIAFSKH